MCNRTRLVGWSILARAEAAAANSIPYSSALSARFGSARRACNFIWPYQRACGAGLFSYMAVEVLIASAAIWVASIAWQHRLGRIHIASLVTLLGALALLAIQVVPRLGYDKAGAPPRQWLCTTR